MNSNIEELNNLFKNQTSNSLAITRTNIPKHCNSNIDMNKINRPSGGKIRKSFLEKRKLSQNLDNFSLKLGQSASALKDSKIITNSSDEMKNNITINSLNKITLEEKCIGAKRKIKTDTKNLNTDNDCLINTDKKASQIQICVEENKMQVELNNEPLDNNGLGIDQPIENEEWLAFIHKTMREVLDGDLDSLKQQNLVRIKSYFGM